MRDEQIPTPTNSIARVRQIILLVILLLAIIALAYEFLIARPKSLMAWKVVNELVNSNYSQPGEVTNTNEIVQTAIGKLPSTIRDEGNQRVETYSWRRGIPIQAYSFEVTYDKKEDGRFLLNAAQAKSLPSESQSNGTATVNSPSKSQPAE